MALYSSPTVGHESSINSSSHSRQDREEALARKRKKEVSPGSKSSLNDSASDDISGSRRASNLSDAIADMKSSLNRIRYQMDALTTSIESLDRKLEQAQAREHSDRDQLQFPFRHVMMMPSSSPPFSGEERVDGIETRRSTLFSVYIRLHQDTLRVGQWITVVGDKIEDVRVFDTFERAVEGAESIPHFFCDRYRGLHPGPYPVSVVIQPGFGGANGLCYTDAMVRSRNLDNHTPPVPLRMLMDTGASMCFVHPGRTEPNPFTGLGLLQILPQPIVAGVTGMMRCKALLANLSVNGFPAVPVRIACPLTAPPRDDGGNLFSGWSSSRSTSTTGRVIDWWTSNRSEAV